ncbi:hypothetical protein F4561_003772 [Lipingzhangella halophila]|uniref:Xaa-Pro dipeptidyl-peptidase-like domain-containing protein n=1 Tax=Lipingzhangella halophila TaxID=1783352 RepID=A0A7W7W3E3_9ACTN|nr:CocE/NonD family hydrolase [Lipingzhangella halophila]MBB4932952.1 hypothetical protein [Lipingzhangella halophila]
MVHGGRVPLAGRVYRQEGDLTVRQPAILVAGSWLTVKEQMAHVYAERLAERGYTAITFDFAGFGQSGGEPRQAEMPSRKIADIDAVARFAATLSFVAPERIGYLGVCASAQYGLAAIARGAPIAAFASVAGWFHDTASVAPFYGGTEGVGRRLERAGAALDTYFATGDVTMVPAYEPGNERAGMHVPLDYYADPARGAIPEWTNEMAEMSWTSWLCFDGLASADRAAAPSLFLHSEGCVFPENVETVRGALAGPGKTVWEQGEQTDFYDQPHHVALAVDAADEHFRLTIGDEL